MTESRPTLKQLDARLSYAVRQAIRSQGGLTGDVYDGDYAIGVILAFLAENDLVLTESGLRRFRKQRSADL